MSKQIIIIDSAEALAEQIAEKLSMNAPHVVAEIATCLHPIEVPSDAGEITEMARDADIAWDGGYYINYKHTPDEIAALITAHSRTVPRAMLEELFDAGYREGDQHIAYDSIDPIRKGLHRVAAKYGYHAE